MAEYSHLRGQMMQSIACSSAILAFSACAALAGGPTVVPTDPEPEVSAPAAAHDWSGPYIGLSYATTSADIGFNPGNDFDFENGHATALHAGYLFQRGSLVYGGELAYGRVGGTFIPGFGGDDEIDYVLDLKARAGVTTNRTLFYGVLGYSKSRYVEPPLFEFDLDGLAYGVGVEVAASDRLIVGLEYLKRDLSGDATSGIVTIDSDANLDTLGLRVGFSF
jgi:outer membrane immunogenic protein